MNLEAADPTDRIRAIVATVEGAGGDSQAAVAALVDRLDDEDLGVRFYAIAGLHRLTGQRFGFRAYDPVDKRRQAVTRWREHLAAAPARGEP